MFYIKKDKNIVLFNKNIDDLNINAKMIGLKDYEIKETSEKIIPAWNTFKTGVYYKASECPQPPDNILTAQEEEKRAQRYAKTTDVLILRRERKKAVKQWLEIDEKNFLEQMQQLNDKIHS